MSQKTGTVENINPNLGEVVLYQSEDGQAAMDVHLKDECKQGFKNQPITSGKSQPPRCMDAPLRHWYEAKVKAVLLEA